MKKSIDANAQLNTKMGVNMNAKKNEYEFRHESHNECKEKCQDEAEVSRRDRTWSGADGEPQILLCSAAKRLSNGWLCADQCLVMMTAEGHLPTVSGGRDQQCKWQVSFDVSILPMMEPGDHCAAPMSNDCQTCGCAHTDGRRSVSLEYLHKDK
jgi:hypothetical protein